MTEQTVLASETVPAPANPNKPAGSGTWTGKTSNKTTKKVKKYPTLLQTGEEETALCLILGMMIIFFVIPAWKKNQDPMN